jgi:hypothetical protein
VFGQGADSAPPEESNSPEKGKLLLLVLKAATLLVSPKSEPDITKALEIIKSGLLINIFSTNSWGYRFYLS